MRRWVSIALLVMGSVLSAGASSSALGAAQPVAPPAGASSGSHPTFSWILPANEEADILTIARRPNTTPAGEFFEENVVDRGFLFEAGQQTTWAPAAALFEGPHWWNVRSHDRETFASFYSVPSQFTVAPVIRLTQVRIRRNSFIYSPDELDFTLRWVTNVRKVLVKARLWVRRSGRPLGGVRSTEETFRSMGENAAYLTWRRPRGVKTGTRIRVLLSVLGGGQGGRSATLTRTVRAP